MRPLNCSVDVRVSGAKACEWQKEKYVFVLPQQVSMWWKIRMSAKMCERVNQKIGFRRPLYSCFVENSGDLSFGLKCSVWIVPEPRFAVDAQRAPRSCLLCWSLEANENFKLAAWVFGWFAALFLMRDCWLRVLLVNILENGPGKEDRCVKFPVYCLFFAIFEKG